jgi:hypothetical protein
LAIGLSIAKTAISVSTNVQLHRLAKQFRMEPPNQQQAVY